ncbi:hypothetical protein LCGC14_1422020 [marine sediment metagenome]|uniref:Peptidase S8/S53 domain-containing protein n=1 Tax=marine sediment metagenome TaxID=412755 RepID=A0A0F9MSV0_9ZZZZ
MKYQKIYTPFIEKLEDQSKKQKVIITFKNLTDRKKFISKNKTLKVIKKFDLIPSIYVDLKKDQILTFDKEKLITQIEEDQRVYLSMLDVIEILEIDDYRVSQISFTGKNINIGIIDEGVNNSFPCISDVNITHHTLGKNKKIKNPKNQDITHGTIMASIISNQFKDSDDTIIGIAPHAKIHDFNISNKKKEYYFSHILEFFDKILTQNISLNILLIPFITLDPSDGKDILSLSCNTLVGKGIIIVSPAGNFGPEPHTIGSPGAAKKVITFGTLEKEIIISEFSGRGPTLDERIKPDFCLPGSKIKLPLSNKLYLSVTGTSISASIGVGMIALILEYNPEIPFEEITKLLEKSSLDLNYDINAQGNGIITIPRIFKSLDLYHEKIVPFSYLIKKSLKISIEFLIGLIIIFYFLQFFRIS